jgi:NAD(P)H dehydrogenase (quinone)
MIAVTGATGKVGRLAADELARRGAGVRLLARDAARAPDVPGGAMVSIHDGPERRLPLHRSFIAAAVRAEVAHIVYLSFVNAGPDAVFLHARSHGETEAMLRGSGLAWTAIRNGMYADEALGWFDPDGVAREPGGDGRISFSYRPELARAIGWCSPGPVTRAGSTTSRRRSRSPSPIWPRSRRMRPAGRTGMSPAPTRTGFGARS